MINGVNITNANPALLDTIDHAHLHVTQYIEFPKEQIRTWPMNGFDPE